MHLPVADRGGVYMIKICKILISTVTVLLAGAGAAAAQS